uniref:Uncharacterized protein n=2 Tax=Musa acuminata subsp. malaccensis TaxID=214687 RepID=A0A804I5P0_MUSAM
MNREIELLITIHTGVLRKQPMRSPPDTQNSSGRHHNF